MLDELATALTAEGFELGDDPVDLLDEVLLDEPRTFDLPDGRVLDLEPLLDDFTVTHRLSGTEANDGIVAVEPDLTPLLATELWSFPLAVGGEVRLVFPGGQDSAVAEDHPLAAACVLVGPPGWLGDAVAGDLLAFRLAGGRLHVGRVEGAADPTQAAGRLAAAFRAAAEDDAPIEGCDLVIVALADAPGLLRRPLPPLSEVYEVAGLEPRGEWVGLAGEDWSWLDEPYEEDEEDAAAAWRQLMGLGEAEAEALGLLLGACDFVARQGPEELAASPQAAAALGRMLDLEGVAEAFVAFTLGRDPDAEAEVAKFSKALIAATPRAAGTHYVLSCCAEYRDDALEAEAHLQAALTADLGFVPALLDAAWYAEDRGDAVRALDYLRRAGVDEDDDQVRRLAWFAAPGPAVVGRNQPCPCGSGRKYKVCCVSRNGHLLPDRAEWLHRKATLFLLRPPQRLVLRDVALARTGTGPDEAAWIEAALEDPFTQDLALFDTGLFESFLASRGVLLPADEFVLGRSWVGVRRSLYEVIEVHPGEGLRLRDLRNGDRLDVTEQLAGQDFALGTLLCARVVPDGRSHQLLGGTISIPFTWRDRLLALLTADPGPEEFAAWFASPEARPMLTNLEGELTVLCEARFAVADPEAAETALARVLDHEDDRFVEYVEIDGAPIVRGSVRRDGGQLVVEANSEERLERLRATVTTAVPDAQLVDERRTGVAEALARAEDDAVPLADHELSAEALEWLDAHMAGLEERWIDEPVPALGGVTPREAVADPTRRRDLEALLNEFETQAAGLPAGARSFDPNRLRRRLGL